MNSNDVTADDDCLSCKFAGYVDGVDFECKNRGMKEMLKVKRVTVWASFCCNWFESRTTPPTKPVKMDFE